ncbi:MAG: asparagine synthase-related protein [Candidatus Bathyarchaeota archaeon]|nr:asparagine synthase-related protein [Candidatus Bathyarchaeota archaeon]
MVNFVIIIDPDGKTRSSYIDKMRNILPFVKGLSISSRTSGDFSAIWAGGAWTPVSSQVDDEGAAILWGDALLQSTSSPVDASQLKILWDNLDGEIPEAFDGYHAAILYKPRKGLVVGSDLLGMFPIYYYARENLIIVASSPEPFRHHPAFQARLNPAGLVGILLTNGLLNGETLLCDTKRMSPGNLLTWKPKTPPKEIPQYRIPLSSKYFNLSFEKHLRILDQALHNAVERHVKTGSDYTFLLSGGLDSRMLGAYINDRPSRVTALTDGLPTDIDMMCAQKIASTLNFKHHPVDIGFEKYPSYAELNARWEHLAGGFHGVRRWGLSRQVGKLSSRVIAAYLGDAVIGGLRISFARKRSRISFGDEAPLSFEAYFTEINRWGIHPKTVKKLVNPEILDNLVPETLHHIKRIYESYSNLEFQRAWCFDLQHTQRFHVGSMPWVLSFGAWPVLPLVDHEILDAIGGMPLSTLENRRLQVELMRCKFPKLSRIPLDHSSYDTTPLQPSAFQRAKQFLFGDGWIWKPSRQARSLRHYIYLHAVKNDPRYYYRIWNMNNQGWQAIRRKAENNRNLVSHIFNSEILARLLPPPEAKQKLETGAVETSGMKCLIGLLLWAETYMSGNFFRT